jgi:hypothetical protein
MLQGRAAARLAASQVRRARLLPPRGHWQRGRGCARAAAARGRDRQLPSSAWGLRSPTRPPPPPCPHTLAPPLPPYPRRPFPQLDGVEIQTPIKQMAFGKGGAYRCILVEQKAVTAARECLWGGRDVGSLVLAVPGLGQGAAGA